MAVIIDGNHYLEASELVQRLAISRQTLWRWRQEGKVPLGHRYRDGRVVFTEDEAEQIRYFANSIKPIQA